MRRSVLCFGDSNTYGHIPGTFSRYDYDTRWPGRLQKILGPGYYVIEEGLNGRTTIYHDANVSGRRAIDYITPCVRTHRPLDFAVVMLGTNDCKSCYGATADEIAKGVSQVVRVIRRETAPYKTKILIVSPVLLGDEIWRPENDPQFDRKSLAVSKELAANYRLVAEAAGCLFLDAATAARASATDLVHLDAGGHDAIARSVAGIILAADGKKV